MSAWPHCAVLASLSAGSKFVSLAARIPVCASSELKAGVMIGQWFSKSKKGEEKASGSPMAAPVAPEAAPTSIQGSLDESLAPEGDANTVIVRAEPATLATDGEGPIPPLVTNAFDAATMMIRPGAE